MSWNTYRFMLPALLCFGLLGGAAELPLDRKQLKAQYRANAQLTPDGILLKSDTAEWDSGVQINPPEGEKTYDPPFQYSACLEPGSGIHRESRLADLLPRECRIFQCGCLSDRNRNR